MTVDNFGDRMKHYEVLESGREFLPLLPIYARIDGRSFSNFTRGLKRPYDEIMSNAMRRTTEYLVSETHARIGYTQSDEISLIWLANGYESEIFFGGRVQKMTSVLAGMASTFFAIELAKDYTALVEKKLPHFDCRVFQVPNRTEGANVFLWREQDATKNAISMAARASYSHKELHGKSGPDMQEMLFQKGINFNDYPPFFKRGTFIRRQVIQKTLTAEELARIPEGRRPDPNTPIFRKVMVELEMPPFSKVINRESVIFDGASPITHTE